MQSDAPTRAAFFRRRLAEVGQHEASLQEKVADLLFADPDGARATWDMLDDGELNELRRRTGHFIRRSNDPLYEILKGAKHVE